MYNIERIETPIYSVQAHDQLVNCIDGAGGIGSTFGGPEIATASRDGVVKVWDTRLQDKPVICISPTNDKIHDCWAVAFGNSYNDSERVIASGYENGDVKMFDLKTCSLLWETNVQNGVCAIEFDRKDIKKNKLVVAGLESRFNVFDLRTLHKDKKFASVAHSVFFY